MGVAVGTVKSTLHAALASLHIDLEDEELEMSDELRHHLHGMAEDVDVPDNARGTVQVRVRRRRAARLAACSVVVALVVGIAAIRSRPATTRNRSRSAPTRPPPSRTATARASSILTGGDLPRRNPGWRSIPEHEAGEPQLPVTVWTGQELLVWSGEAGSESNVPPSGGGSIPWTSGGGTSPTRPSVVDPRHRGSGPATRCRVGRVVRRSRRRPSGPGRPPRHATRGASSLRRRPRHGVPGGGVDRDRDGRDRRNPRRRPDRGADRDRATTRRATGGGSSRTTSPRSGMRRGVWTGDEVIVWGGRHEHERPGLPRGRARSGDRSMAESPRPVRGFSHHSAVWTGDGWWSGGGCRDDR